MSVSNYRQHCILCYCSYDFNWNVDQFPAQLSPSAVSSCLKYIPPDIHQTVDWNQFDANNCLRLCDTCDGNLKNLSKLNWELEEIQRKISELANCISIHVKRERENFGGQEKIGQNSTHPDKNPTTSTLASNIAGLNKVNFFADHTTLKKQMNSNVDEKGEDETVDNNLEYINSDYTDQSDDDEVENGTTSNSDMASNVPNSIPPSKIKVQCLEQTKPKSSLQKLLDSTSGYECSTCNKKFSRYTVLQKHDCGKPTVECEACGCSFSSSGVLKLHIRSHTGEKPFKCETCGQAFSTRGNLTTHIQGQHSNDKPFECEICGKKFPYGVALSKHKISKHETRKELYKCDVCGKNFKVLNALKSHLVTHSTGTSNPFKCDLCEKTFARPMLVQKHKKRVHFGGCPTVVCDICGKSVDKYSLEKHKMVHSGEKPFQCSQCGKNFRTSTVLKDHEFTHKEEAVFTCSICGKSCKTPQSLRVHSRFHTDKITCDVCGKSIRPSNFTAHQRMHTGEKLLKCDSCEKRFSSRKELNNHVDRFCHICNKSFYLKAKVKTLAIHQAEVHTVSTILYPEKILTDGNKSISMKSKRKACIRRGGKRKSIEINYKESSSEQDEPSSDNCFDEDDNDSELKIEVKVEDEFSEIEDSDE